MGEHDGDRFSAENRGADDQGGRVYLAEPRNGEEIREVQGNAGGADARRVDDPRSLMSKRG